VAQPDEGFGLAGVKWRHVCPPPPDFRFPPSDFCPHPAAGTASPPGTAP
jgi:hypothetical protein